MQGPLESPSIRSQAVTVDEFEALQLLKSEDAPHSVGALLLELPMLRER